MITTDDPGMHLLLTNFREKVHIEYVKPNWVMATDSLQENTNPYVTVDYNRRNLKVNIIIEV